MVHEMRTVIINVGTDLVATLAVASAARHTPGPVTLINCGAEAESMRWFRRLSGALGFQVVDAPVREHGAALDSLFQSCVDEVLLVLDSDAEILDGNVTGRMLSYFDHPRVFGAGYTNGPGWLHSEEGGVTGRVGYFQERPWMPYAMFRTSHVRDALRDGKSFSAFTFWNDLPVAPGLSRLLARRLNDHHTGSSRVVDHLPQRVQQTLRRPLDSLAWLRRDFYGNRPNYVYYDTGADLYQWCKYQQGWIYAGLDESLGRAEVNHLGGVTRKQLDPSQVYGALDAGSVEEQVSSRLRSEYDIDYPMP